MDINRLINEELSNLNETYNSVIEIQDLANDIIKEAAKLNIDYINNMKSFTYLYGVGFPKLKTSIDIDKYNELKGFINRMNIYVYFQSKTNDKPNGEYSFYRSKEKSKFKLFDARELNVYYDYDEVKHDVDEKINKNGQITVDELYMTLFFKMFSTLIHELQHAYDEYRSRGMAFNTKQFDKYLDKYAINGRQDNVQLKKDIDQAKAYLKLPHEIWARFTQAIYELSFYDIDIDKDKTGKDRVIYIMYPINDVVKKFTRTYKNFNILNEKDKRKLINKVVQFWHMEKEKYNAK